jgi:anti-sigma regulatory factor (Ser/Thr protein kinase)/DNA-binding transcriptional ArsR family regulator
MAPKPKSDEIRKFITDHVEQHPRDIARMTSERFGITRQAVNRHLTTLIEDEVIEARGKTREREYALKVHKTSWTLLLAENRDEDQVWRTHVEPDLTGLPENVLRICYYGFAEIFNNAIDHSEGTEVTIIVERSARRISMLVGDNGVGIFEKIRRHLGIDDHRRAVLELFKGKLTTDPKHHTGQGIFFTSRIFDVFVLSANDYAFGHNFESDDYMFEKKIERERGTIVQMEIAADSKKKLKELFDKFSDLESGNYDFSKTHVPIGLARYGKDFLVSRSQARRVLARFEEFKEVYLDFKDVDEIGQAFADEIFRVFANEHPEVTLRVINATEPVQQMINRAIAAWERDRRASQ